MADIFIILAAMLLLLLMLMFPVLGVALQIAIAAIAAVVAVCLIGKAIGWLCGSKTSDIKLTENQSSLFIPQNTQELSSPQDLYEENYHKSPLNPQGQTQNESTEVINDYSLSNIKPQGPINTL